MHACAGGSRAAARPCLSSSPALPVPQPRDALPEIALRQRLGPQHLQGEESARRFVNANLPRTTPITPSASWRFQVGILARTLASEHRSRNSARTVVQAQAAAAVAGSSSHAEPPMQSSCSVSVNQRAENPVLPQPQQTSKLPQRTWPVSRSTSRRLDCPRRPVDSQNTSLHTRRIDGTYTRARQVHKAVVGQRGRPSSKLWSTAVQQPAAAGTARLPPRTGTCPGSRSGGQTAALAGRQTGRAAAL